MGDRYELVRFEKDGLILDVNVSPSEDTVWLSLNEMCLLFGRDKSVISRHIKNVFKEAELDSERVVAKKTTTASDGKVYERHLSMPLELIWLKHFNRVCVRC